MTNLSFNQVITNHLILFSFTSFLIKLNWTWPCYTVVLKSVLYILYYLERKLDINSTLFNSVVEQLSSFVERVLANEHPLCFIALGIKSPPPNPKKIIKCQKDKSNKIWVMFIINHHVSVNYVQVCLPSPLLSFYFVFFFLLTFSPFFFFESD